MPPDHAWYRIYASVHWRTDMAVIVRIEGTDMYST